ncbi:MAG TPA: DinB family protein [Bryobacteraceae bacterium]|jgi:hypothetical protein|nr:DinB family protein [Bryobacteraceae bacterium]
MDQANLETLRKQLVSALDGGESHATFEDAVKDFKPDMYGAKPAGVPHSAWELVDHMRIAQRDILDFSRNPEHKSPEFPKGYWPKTAAPPNNEAWENSVKALLQDRRELAALLEKEDLFAAFAHGDGQTLLREALVAANHNSYHLGQLIFLKRILLEKA